MFERFKQAVECLSSDAPQREHLSSLGASAPDVELIAKTIAEEYILRSLSKLNQAEVSKQLAKSTTRSSLHALRNALLTHTDTSALLCRDIAR